MKTTITTGIMGFGDNPNSKRIIKDLRHLKALLLGKELAKEIVDALIKTAITYPQGSLDYFWQRIDSHIYKAEKNLIKKNKISQTTIEIPSAVAESPKPQEKPIKKKKEPMVKRKSILDNVVPIPEKKEEKPPEPTPKKPVIDDGMPRRKDGSVDIEALVIMKQDKLKNRVNELIEREKELEEKRAEEW